MEDVRGRELIAFIRQMLDEKNYRGLKGELADLYPMDIAEIFDDLPHEECVIIFRLLQKDRAAEVFSYLSTQRQKDIVGAISAGLLNHIFSELYFDDKIDFLEEMPANFVKRVVASSPPEERGLINQFLSFPENSAGSLMTIEYVELKQHMTVRQALDHIKQVGMDKETVYTCYVLDDTRRLEGLVSLRKLVLSDDNTRLGDIMTTDVVVVESGRDQEEVADLFKKYDFMAIPVVDGENRLIGIITIDDIVDVIEQENTEDFHVMAAISPSDDEYLNTGVVLMSRRRIVWLLVLMISATFTGSIIGHYEDLVTSVGVLAIFIPMLMNTSGSAGCQSSTLIIRGIALGEIEMRDWLRIFWKELRVGLLAGSILVLVNMARMLFLGRNDTGVVLTVSITLLTAVVLAKLIGGLLPIAAKTFRLDPAIMATPLITTIVDAVSLFVYFAVASALIL